MKKFILLDRDGVINYDSTEYIKSPDEWHAIPKSLEAIASLNRAGYHVLVLTNQSGVGRGYYSIETLDAIHEKMFAELAAVGGCIDDVFFCPHLPAQSCDCRKPAPGLVRQAEEKYQLNLTEIYFIGDKATDVECARATGCIPLLVSTGYDPIDFAKNPELKDVPYFVNLANAVEFVLSNKSSPLFAKDVVA